MTVDLQRELAELAEGARSYADLPAVLDQARRIRRRRRLVPASAAVALVAVVAVVWATVPLRGGGPPPTSDGPFPELPRLVESPAEPPPSLPSDRAVGEAALVHQCRGCPVHLVLPDGAQYRLDGDADRDGGWQAALSPDGRWLGLQVAEGFLVRDLTSTEQETYEGFTGTAWSPNSRWLLGRSGGSSYSVLDVATGELTPVSGDQSGVLGLSPQILDSGELVIVDDLATAEDRLVVRVVEPATGQLQRQLEIDTRPLLGPDERTTIPDPVLEASQATLTVGDGRVGLVYITPPEEGEPVAPRQVVGVVLVSLEDGGLLGRVDAPQSPSFWLPSRFAGGLVLGLHLPSERGEWELLAHEPHTGTTQVVSRLASDGAVMPRQTEAMWFVDPDE